MTVVRWRLDLEYDGGPFAGWQLQPNAPTIQAALEDALARLLGHPVRIASAAGRTDTGVHAARQVCVFDTEVARDPGRLRDGLDALLPPEVACLGARQVPADWDPRRAPHTKTYRYTWLVRPARSPLRRGRAWHVKRPMDPWAMDEAVRVVVGSHDFTSFRAQGCTATHALRTVGSASVAAVEDELRLSIRGTGFLRHMVRILAGTLYEVGAGRRPPAWVGEVLAARDRTAAGRTAPAEGLLLEDVVYAEEPQL